MHLALATASPSSLDKSWIDTTWVLMYTSPVSLPPPSTLCQYQSECIAIGQGTVALHARLRFLSSPLTLIGCFIAQLNRKTEILCIVTETIMTSVRNSREQRTVRIPPSPKGKWIHWAYGSLTLLRFMSLPTILFLLFVNLQFDFGFKFSHSLYWSHFARTSDVYPCQVSEICFNFI